MYFFENVFLKRSILSESNFKNVFFEGAILKYISKMYFLRDRKFENVFFERDILKNVKF